MSLKGFHILFVLASIVLSLGCAYASAKAFFADPTAMRLGSVALAVAGAAILVVYVIRAVRWFRSMGVPPNIN